jgi:hypothetical protein
VRRADRSPLKFNAKLSRPFSIVPIRLSAPYYDPAVHTHTAEGTNLQNFKFTGLLKLPGNLLNFLYIVFKSQG